MSINFFAVQPVLTGFSRPIRIVYRKKKAAPERFLTVSMQGGEGRPAQGGIRPGDTRHLPGSLFDSPNIPCKQKTRRLEATCAYLPVFSKRNRFCGT